MQKNAPVVNKLSFIDAGLVTSLSSEDKKNFIDLFMAVAKGDGWF